MAIDEREPTTATPDGVRREPLDANESPLPGLGLLKGLGVTLKHMLRPSVTKTYPHVHPDLPARTRGVIALKEANCTVCYKCSRACPDWCIYIDAHKEVHEPASGGKGRSVKVLDRFAIDYSLCMYCGICVEVCPFDALFWSPEFEYAEYDIHGMLHEKERLEEWTYTVPPPPLLEVGAEPPPAPAAASAVAVAPAAVPTTAPGPAAAAPAGAAISEGQVDADTAAASAPPAAAAPRPPRAPRIEAEPDQATYDRVLAEQLAKGTDRRIAEGRAKSAALKAGREKASGGAV
jgi:formate hydrogenlyase subunit 6/NADH:ubiquinone oxidoreductase subunit I